MVRTNVLAVSVTKLTGRHTIKGGYQLDHSLRSRTLGPPARCRSRARSTSATTATTRSIRGTATRMRRSASFRRYAQQNKLLEGNYIYDSHEFFLQDNWKITDKLTLDYGMRFTHQGPQYDTKLQSSNFFSDKWSRANAPLLYVPGCSVSTTALSGRQSRGRQSRHGRFAGRRVFRSGEYAGAELRRPHQRHHQGGRGHRQDRLYVAEAGAGAARRRRRTTSTAISRSWCAAASASSSIGRRGRPCSRSSATRRRARDRRSGTGRCSRCRAAPRS